ncbi:MAG: hypothetical protein Q8N16_03195 [bacterium]|nr:hypothetical protein [bacterium]
MKRTNRIDVVVLVDPVGGITHDQAREVVRAVLKYNNDESRPLSRLTLTGQETTTTQWPDLLPFLDWARIIRQGDGLRIFGNLIGMTPETARVIAELKVRMYGEWFGPSLDEVGVQAMVNQGTAYDEATAMLAGIKTALATGALIGLEFQVNRQNISYVEDFLRLCQELGIEGHLEMQETQFSKPRNLAVAKMYRQSLPPKEQLRRICEIVAAQADVSPDNLVSPFFTCGSQDGACNYFYRGLFIRPNGRGGLRQTVCLSELTVIDDNFKPSWAQIGHSLRNPVLALRNIAQEQMEGGCRTCSVWSQCLGGCRAMAYLASGSRFAPDPNCWK